MSSSRLRPYRASGGIQHSDISRNLLPEECDQEQRDEDEREEAIDENSPANGRAVCRSNNADALRRRNEIDIEWRIQEERKRAKSYCSCDDIQHQGEAKLRLIGQP